MVMDENLHRRSIRLPGRDYAFPGTYFVTICSYEQRHILGKITDSKFIPNELGRLVRECWVAIPLHFAQVDLREFVVMPNHMHGLIQIISVPGITSIHSTSSTVTPLVGAQHCCARSAVNPDQTIKPGSLGAIVRSFKSIVARRAHSELSWEGPIWQRNYFERVLRSGKEFADASRYLAENPRKWDLDRGNHPFWMS